MDSALGWIYAALATAIAVAVSLFAFFSYKIWLSKKRKEPPKRSPLQANLIVNAEECRVWGWLAKIFYDHHVMIKTPVKRFTLPHSTDGEDWYERLSSVYCTFTICTGDGRVVGCIDVPRKNGLSRSNQQLKQSLLSECGIAYYVINSDNFPTMSKIRSEFLGEPPLLVKPEKEDEHSVNVARDKLRQAIERRRSSRFSELGALMPEPLQQYPTEEAMPSSSFESDFGMDAWQTNNSFLVPLESRSELQNGGKPQIKPRTHEV